MTHNLLKHEASPYLLQHQDNPVHWRAWGPSALEEAQRMNRPILLSVGYAACHWCHVMAHESFEDPATADVMNRLFVNIKVDREERPDIDQIYMAALHALGEQGGWPLTMFLTPDAAPIWGGTYFPPTARYGRPAFVDILSRISKIFHEDPDRIDKNRTLLLNHLSQPEQKSGAPLDGELLDRAAARLFELVDLEHGGTRGAPKFPQPSLLELFWRAGDRTNQPDYQDAAILTLRNICAGGIYDHVGGGFARYTVDDRWLVPHFEKMLYDNAQLVELLGLAFAKTGDQLFRVRIEQTIAWLEREMLVEDGVYAASLDADSEGVEGKFYVWSYDEILDVLGPQDGTLFAEAYDITYEGNWDGHSIPNRLHHLALADTDTEFRLANLRDKLLERRQTRIRPGRDDKVLADWNGLMIAALATAGALLNRSDWIDLAIRSYSRLITLMSVNSRLAHSYRGGKSVFPGLATDYAATVKAALSLFSATQDRTYLADAERLTDLVHSHHWDSENHGYYLTADDADPLIIRPRSNVDEATPSANATMGANLARLWRLTGADKYRHDLDDLLHSAAGTVSANLFSTAATLNALDLRLNAIDIIVTKPPSVDAGPALTEIRRHWSPNAIMSLHDTTVSLPDTHPAAGKAPIDGKVTVYICRGETCSLPVTELEKIAILL